MLDANEAVRRMNTRNGFDEIGTDDSADRRDPARVIRVRATNEATTDGDLKS